mgnify:FL=1
MIRINVSTRRNEKNELSFDVFIGDSKNPHIFLTVPSIVYEETMKPILTNLVEERSYTWEDEEHICKDCQDQQDETPQDSSDQSEEINTLIDELDLDDKITKH